jgi:hypothetical protein
LPPELQESENVTQDGTMNEDKQSIIKRIIKVKQDLDSELARMQQPEQIPRGLEPPPLIKKKRRNLMTNRTNADIINGSSLNSGPVTNRVVMQEGIYDRAAIDS